MAFVRERVMALYKQIEDAEKEMEDIRKNICEHKDYQLGNYGDFRYSTYSHICNDCNARICDATKEEFEAYSLAQPQLPPMPLTRTIDEIKINQALQKTLKKEKNKKDIL